MNRRMAFAESMTQPAPPPPAPSPPATAPQGGREPGYLVELEQLASLHASGVLTDDEFAAKKAQILGL